MTPAHDPKPGKLQPIGPPRKIKNTSFTCFRSMKIAWNGPKRFRKICPTNQDPANILGRTDSRFPDLRIPRLSAGNSGGQPAWDPIWSTLRFRAAQSIIWQCLINDILSTRNKWSFSRKSAYGDQSRGPNWISKDQFSIRMVRKMVHSD